MARGGHRKKAASVIAKLVPPSDPRSRIAYGHMIDRLLVGVVSDHVSSVP